MTEPTRWLRVRFARRQDINRVRAFYNQNQPLRSDPQDILAMLGTSKVQRLYVIEETQNKQIVAAGACFEHCEGRFVEVRDAVVRWKGYGLQRVLTHIRTLQSLIMTNSGVSLFCIVEPALTDLRNRMQALGFEPWEQPAEELTKELASQRHSAENYMKFAPEQVEEHRQSLLELSRTQLVRHIETGETAGLSLEILLNSDPDFRRALENFPLLPKIK